MQKCWNTEKSATNHSVLRQPGALLCHCYNQMTKGSEFRQRLRFAEFSSFVKRMLDVMIRRDMNPPN